MSLATQTDRMDGSRELRIEIIFKEHDKMRSPVSI